MGFVRTDLAMENIDRENICPGTDVHQWENGDIQITEVIIRTEEANLAEGIWYLRGLEEVTAAGMSGYTILQ